MYSGIIPFPVLLIKHANIFYDPLNMLIIVYFDVLKNAYRLCVKVNAKIHMARTVDSEML